MEFIASDKKKIPNNSGLEWAVSLCRTHTLMSAVVRNLSTLFDSPLGTMGGPKRIARMSACPVCEQVEFGKSVNIDRPPLQTTSNNRLEGRPMELGDGNPGGTYRDLTTYGHSAKTGHFCQPSDEVQYFGNLRVQRLNELPDTATSRIARSVFFVDMECGGFYSLHGSDRLFHDSASAAVFAIVLREAKLLSPEEEAPFVLKTGIWAVWHVEVDDLQ